MRVAVLTKEWPPDIYGGAGVHVEHLVAQLRSLIEVQVECFGAPKEGADAHPVPEYLQSANPALQTLGVDLAMVESTAGVDLLHSHTWYTNFAGQVGSLLHGVPHVVTAHSLEPLRPWKAEQLGGGYRVSSWVEKSAYHHAHAIIAVSAGMRADILRAYPDVDPDRVHVVHNGIDTVLYHPVHDESVLSRYGIDASKPYVLFVGRITRQKGLVHLLAAARNFTPDIQLVLCASSPDTPEIAQETSQGVELLRTERGESSVIWVQDPVPRDDLIALFTHARVFACPSIYEPLGIVNLEAMACETAVVASDVGGIPEVVVNGETGVLVPYDPAEPRAFEHAFADAVNRVADNEDRARRMGAAGRARAVADFSWQSIAEQTLAVYRTAQQVYARDSQ